MGEAGDKAASQQPTDLERRGSVEQLTQEKRKTYSAMMSEMERQVGNYGQFFVEEGFSEKSSHPHQRDKDTRVLLLTEPVRDPGKTTTSWNFASRNKKLKSICKTIASKAINASSRLPKR